MAGARHADADHRDAPGVLIHPSASLNDAYAFVDPNDPSMIVLAMTVNGYTVPGVHAFTFDEIFIRNILRGTLAAPVPPNTAPFRSTPGIDYYAGRTS